MDILIQSKTPEYEKIYIVKSMHTLLNFFEEFYRTVIQISFLSNHVW